MTRTWRLAVDSKHDMDNTVGHEGIEDCDDVLRRRSTNMLDDLTERSLRALKRSHVNTLRILSCSVWQKAEMLSSRSLSSRSRRNGQLAFTFLLTNPAPASWVIF